MKELVRFFLLLGVMFVVFSSRRRRCKTQPATSGAAGATEERSRARSDERLMSFERSEAIEAECVSTGSRRPTIPEAVAPAPSSSMATFLVESATILAALLFVTGWQYGHAYYSVFGVGLAQLEIPILHYFVWVRPIFLEYWYLTWPIVLITILTVGVGGELLAQKLSSKRSGIGRVLRALVGDGSVRILVVLLILLLAFPFAALKAGRDHGRRDLYGDTTTLSIAALNLKNPEGDSDAMLRVRTSGVSDGDYYLLGRHRGIYYLVPYRSLNAVGLDDTPLVVMVPDEMVAAVRIKE